MNRKIENRNYGKRALISFFAIVILISAVVETLICRGGAEWLYTKTAENGFLIVHAYQERK